MLKIKPDYPATFHMDGLLSVPTGVGCSYTGVKYKDPPFAMYASSGAAAQPLPTTIGKPETQITCASVGAVALPSPGAAEIVETQDMTQDMTQESSPSKIRTVFTEDQRSELRRAFDDNKYFTRDEMQQLASNAKICPATKLPCQICMPPNPFTLHCSCPTIKSAFFLHLARHER